MFNWLKRKEQPQTEEEIREQQEQQQKVEEGLTRTRRGFFRQIASLFEVDEITEDIWEDLEVLLLQSDVGVDTTVAVLDRLKERIASLRYDLGNTFWRGRAEKQARALWDDLVGPFQPTICAGGDFQNRAEALH